MAIEFNSINSVNIKDIDEQHKKIIEIINRFSEIMKKADDKSKVLEILDELDDYSREHLEYEEKLFKKHDYGDKENHIRAHQFYRDKVAEFKNQCKQEEGFGFVPDVFKFLRDWWINHINNADIDYSEFFNKKGIF